MSCLVCLWFFSADTAAHSLLFEDYYSFDETNGGQGISDAQQKLLKKNTLALLNITQCEAGLAGPYPCANIDLLSFMSLREMGGGEALLNDIWGWTDPLTGQEIAIVGRENGVSFIDVSDGLNPVFLAFLPDHSQSSSDWRDAKVYQHHVFIVSEVSNAGAGLQIYDLRELRDIVPGSVVEETAHFDGFSNAHNLFIHEETGYAYIVGSQRCGQGLYIVDVSQPTQPQFEGCFSEDGYTHDVQCVIYNGPDVEHSGKEICVAYNEDAVTIVDVTNKNNPIQLSSTSYSAANYTHQGWFVDDTHSMIIVNDELDEVRAGMNTTSYIFDVSDLDRPELFDTYVSSTNAIDHNLYVHQGLVYQSNYRAGLRILSTENIDEGRLKEVAFFDTIPQSDDPRFSGSWSNYPYFASGKIIISDIGNGLFILQPENNLFNAEPTRPSPNPSPSNQPLPTASSTPNDIDNQNNRNLGGCIHPWVVLGLIGLLMLSIPYRSKP